MNPFTLTKSWEISEHHQAVLDVVYDQWQKEKNWNYADMVDWTRLTYGEAFAFLILAGKYNQQVENGGHGQYLYNDYPNRTPNGYDMMLHIKMMKWHTKFCNGEASKKVLDVMKQFIVSADKFHDKEEYEEYGGSLLDQMDDDYYSVNNKWLSELEDLAYKSVTELK